MTVGVVQERTAWVRWSARSGLGAAGRAHLSSSSSCMSLGVDRRRPRTAVYLTTANSATGYPDEETRFTVYVTMILPYGLHLARLESQLSDSQSPRQQQPWIRLTYTGRAALDPPARSPAMPP